MRIIMSLLVIVCIFVLISGESLLMKEYKKKSYIMNIYDFIKDSIISHINYHPTIQYQLPLGQNKVVLVCVLQ